MNTYKSSDAAVEKWEQPVNEHYENFLLKTQKFAERLSNLSNSEIAQQYSYMTKDEHFEFVSETLGKIGVTLKGNGVEAGAGVGLLSLSLARLYPEISSIKAVELSPFVAAIQRKLFEGAYEATKITPVAGNFNTLNVSDASLDFCVEFDAFHHSDDFGATIEEMGRAIKKGGQLVCFDRVHRNSISNAQIEYLLEKQYSDEYKIENNISLLESWTRRDNGEHEIRIGEWRQHLEKNGFQPSFYIFQKRNFKSFLKVCVGLLPFSVKRMLGLGLSLSTHSIMLKHYLPFFANTDAEFDGIFALSFTGDSLMAPVGKVVIVAEKIE